MSIFLFCKQIVDMLYQYKILDYGMVLFALVLICYKIRKEKIYKDMKEFFCPADMIVFALMLIYVLAFLKYTNAYGIFFKVESCFLIYFLGRLYGKEIMQHGKVLAAAGYIVVYINFIYRYCQFGYKFIVTGPEVTLLNSGGLYYYKTDLAIGMIVALIFIYHFSQVRWFKWFTIIPICGYMVFYSGARMQQLIMAAEYVLILLCELEKRTKFALKLHEKCMKVIIGIGFSLTAVFFAALQLFPFDKVEAGLQVDTGAGSFLENLMHSRHIIWWDILKYFSEQSLFTRIFGIDLQTEYLHNAQNMRAHSAYVKQIYSTGYVGCFLFLTLIAFILLYLCREKNKKMVYMILALWLMFLGAGLTIESLEATQMSWFPMLFTGVLFVKEKSVHQAIEEQY